MASVRAEFWRWMEAESGTWRAWTMLGVYFLGPLVIGLVIRACRHSE